MNYLIPNKQYKVNVKGKACDKVLESKVVIKPLVEKDDIFIPDDADLTYLSRQELANFKPKSTLKASQRIIKLTSKDIFPSKEALELYYKELKAEELNKKKIDMEIKRKLYPTKKSIVNDEAQSVEEYIKESRKSPKIKPLLTLSESEELEREPDISTNDE